MTNYESYTSEDWSQEYLTELLAGRLRKVLPNTVSFSYEILDNINGSYLVHVDDEDEFQKALRIETPKEYKQRKLNELP